MAVTLVSTPDLHALTKGGRMSYRFSGAGRLASTGVAAVGQLVVAGVVAPGTMLNLRWNGVDHTLKFVETPSAPGEFTAGDGSASFVYGFIVELNAYYPIREDFRAVQVDALGIPTIELRAKRAGIAYNIEYHLATPGVSPFNTGPLTLGADPTYRTQYSIYSEVWIQKPGTAGTDPDAHFSRIYTATGECDEAGQASFDVGGILHAQLTADWPAFSGSTPLKATNSYRKYYVVFGEAYGSPLQPGKLIRDQIRHAYLGGADYKSRASQGFGLDGFELKALRFGSLTRVIHLDEIQFLSFVNVTDTQYYNLNLHYELTFSDGSTAADSFDFETQTLLVGEKITYPVGPAQLDIYSLVPQNKTLSEYSIRLVLNGNEASSPLYRYILNGAYQRYTRQFAYLSSLGCPETLYTYGKGSPELAIFSEQAARYLPTGYEVKDGQFVLYDTSTQQSVEVATGFWPESVLRSWTDFYRSPVRFRLKGGLALPIGLVSKSIKQAKDGETLFAHSWQYQYLYQDDFYTGDAEDELGDGPLPGGFLPIGSVSISQPTVVHAVDPTVPDVVRAITQADVLAWKQKAAEPNPDLAGYLTEELAAGKFRRADTDLDWATEITGKPNTRDGYGLTDVPTKDEIEHLTAGGLRLPANSDAPQADGLIGHIGGQAVTLTYDTIWDQLLDSGLTVQQVVLFKALLKVTLDEALKNGPESGREQIIKASHRRSLTLADSLEYFQGTTQVGSLHEERYLSAKDVAKALTPFLDFDIIKSVIDDHNGQSDNTPFQWLFYDVLACEDKYKTFAPDDYDNKDYQ